MGTPNPPANYAGQRMSAVPSVAQLPPPVVVAPPPPPPAPQPVQEGPSLHIEDLDGGAVGILPLNLGENVLGRNASPLLAGDALLSGRHATIFVQGTLAMVRDEGSRNGVFVRMAKGSAQALQDGDQFLAGRVLLRWDARNTGPLPGEEGPAALPEALTMGQLALVLGRDVDPTLFPAPIPRAGITLGRKRGDLRFPSDPWISGEHCRLGLEGDTPTLTDLESANGTWFRIRGPVTVNHKDSLILGRRVFHLYLPA